MKKFVAIILSVITLVSAGFLCQNGSQNVTLADADTTETDLFEPDTIYILI